MTFRRALFIRFGGFGDILLTTPVIRAVRRAYPNIEIDYIVGAGMAEALEGHPMVRRIITFDKQGADARAGRFLSFLLGLSRERYDLVVNLHPSAKSYAMRLATGASRAITFRKDMSIHQDTGRVTHAIDDFLKDLAPLGIAPGQDRDMDYFVPDSAVKRVSGLLREEGIEDDALLFVINPAASRPINRWPAERFAEVAAHFAGQSRVAVCVTGAPETFKTFLGGPPDKSVAAQIAGADARIHNLAGKLTLKELGALLIRADAFLTSDTGPMQIASAVGTPTVVLAGAADPDRTGPLARHADVLIDRSLPCVPCRDRTCARGDVKCMDNLSVESVIAAIAFKMRRSRKAVHEVLMQILIVCGVMAGSGCLNV
jgi:ADP-heptose:LPS heptosyltransferase